MSNLIRAFVFLIGIFDLSRYIFTHSFGDIFRASGLIGLIMKSAKFFITGTQLIQLILRQYTQLI
ncbi:MAG TPA: hypothetical protein VN414_03875, partial [Methanosarcina sp.]|nr:hypothetical protein [Methanosarcina sp.]